MRINTMLLLIGLAVGGEILCLEGMSRNKRLDLNGDGLSELVVVDKSGVWAAMSHDGRYFAQGHLGDAKSTLVSGHYSTSPGIRTELGVFEPISGTWEVKYPGKIWSRVSQFGFKDVTPVPADFDGDGLTDQAVYYVDGKGVGQWAISGTKTGFRSLSFGFSGGRPYVGDFDGDGKAEPAFIWQDPATKTLRWWIHYSKNRVVSFNFGPAGAIPASGRYIDGRRTNPTVYYFNPATGVGSFYISKTGAGDPKPIVLPVGRKGDMPIGGLDLDKDGKDDVAVYNQATGTWRLGMSRLGGKTVQFGYGGAMAAGTRFFDGGLDFNGDMGGDLTVVDTAWRWSMMSQNKSFFSTDILGNVGSIPVPGVYNRPGNTRRADLGVYNAESGMWHMKPISETRWTGKAHYGFHGAVCAPGDYDGDGIDDVGVYYVDGAGNGQWSIQRSSKGPWNFAFGGAKGACPFAGDFNGDGSEDPSLMWLDVDTEALHWAIYYGKNNIQQFTFGRKGDIPIPGRYHGGRKTVPALYRFTDGKGWFVISNLGGVNLTPIALDIGANNKDYVPVGGCDFDGDGKDDIAAYLPATGKWVMGMSTAGGKTMLFGHAKARAAGASLYSEPGADYLPIIEPKDFKGTLWKTPNHSGNGTVVLLSTRYRHEYDAKLWTRMVVSTDPAGENVRPSGVGRIVSPYADGRPVIRFDKLGTYYRPGPVYMVLFYKDGRRQPWLIPDPGMRTE